MNHFVFLNIAETSADVYGQRLAKNDTHNILLFSLHLCYINIINASVYTKIVERK